MIEITQKDFEGAMPAMAFPTPEVYDKVSPHFKDSYEYYAGQVLGDTGVSALDGNDTLLYVTKRVVCLEAVCRIFASLDIVATPTGFGVVSNQNTAPASASRVNALQKELRTALLRAEGWLATLLCAVNDWGIQEVATRVVPYLFFRFSQLRTFCGMPNATCDDWTAAQPKIIDADEFLRIHVGDEMMDDLLDKTRTDTLEGMTEAANAMLEVFAAYILDDSYLKGVKYRRLQRLLDSDLEKYSLYRDSAAYRLNHSEQYENTGDKAAFVFRG